MKVHIPELGLRICDSLDCGPATALRIRRSEVLLSCLRLIFLLFLFFPFLLLFLGVAVPTVFYIIWGIMEIIQIPLAR